MLISCTRLRGGMDIGRSHIPPKDQSICSPRPNLISMLLAVSNCGSATYAWMLSRRHLCEAVRAACSPASAFSISLCLEHLKGLLACAPILWNYPKVREFKDTLSEQNGSFVGWQLAAFLWGCCLLDIRTETAFPHRAMKAQNSSAPVKCQRGDARFVGAYGCRWSM
jgi:hypothetical protein